MELDSKFWKFYKQENVENLLHNLLYILINCDLNNIFFYKDIPLLSYMNHHRVTDNINH